MGFAHGNPDPIPFPPGQQNYDPAFARREGENADARVGGGPRVFRAYIRVGLLLPLPTSTTVAVTVPAESC